MLMIACMHGSGVDVREMSGKALLVYIFFRPFQFSVRWRLRNPWQAPAVRGWTVCRFHGAHGRAPKGKGNGAYRHGLHTRQTIEARQL